MGADGRSALLGAIERWNRGDLSAYMDLYDENVVLHRLPRDVDGKEAVRSMYSGMWSAFPSSRLTLDDVIADGDRVACRYQWDGKHKDGREARAWGMTILHFANGQCVERWDLEAGH